jgi:hypothetical protein
MKTSATVLAILALLVLISCTQALAAPSQAPQAAVAAAPAIAPATAQFLASLAASQTPVFMTGCTSNAQCPAGQLCCYPCGIEGCENVCMTPWRGGECPAFP